MKKGTFISVLLLLLMLLPFSYASAGNIPKNVELNPIPEVQIYKNGDIHYFFGGKVNNKKITAQILDNLYKTVSPKNPGEPSAKSVLSYTLSAYKKVDFGNYYCYAKFDSDLHFNAPRFFGPTRITVTQSTSHTAWLGTTPQDNADVLTHSDDFTWNAIGSVSISVTGGGFSVSGHTAHWQYTSYNTWYDTHTFGGLTGSGNLTSISQSSTGDFRFDSVNTSVTPTAYNSMWVK